ncbi:histidine kinase, partial [Streptomyces tateyamensis]
MKARPLYGAQMWREVRHHLMSLPFGIAAFVFTVTVLSVGTALSVTVIGLPLLALGLRGCRALGAVARRRARADLGARLEEPDPLVASRPGTAGRVIAALTSGLNWRSALYCVLLLPWGVLSFTVTLAFLVVGWPLLPFVVRYLAVAHRVLVE